LERDELGVELAPLIFVLGIEIGGDAPVGAFDVEGAHEPLDLFDGRAHGIGREPRALAPGKCTLPESMTRGAFDVGVVVDRGAGRLACAR
jgi:hypothetical protein